MTIQFNAGSQVAGKYIIDRMLGEGAMGEVYLCKHKDLGDKNFVLKILKNEISGDKVTAQRFKNEVIAALNVSHENVVRAYEFINEQDFIGYTMEFVQGGDLADLMEVNHTFPVPATVNYMKQMCAGVAALHKHGIIHRDIKPENILITQDDIVKISDFGISILDNNSRMTETGTLLGSTNYIAPEYIQYQKVDERTDIYALGIVAYEMICGTDPFPGDNIYIKMEMRTKVDPHDPRMYRTDCPDLLAEWILKAISMSPTHRFQSCEDMIESLTEMGSDGKGGDKAKSNKKTSSIGKKGGISLEPSKYQDPNSEESVPNSYKKIKTTYKSDIIDLSAKEDEQKNFSTTSLQVSPQKKGINFTTALALVVAIVATLVGGRLIYNSKFSTPQPVVISAPPVIKPPVKKLEQLPEKIVLLREDDNFLLDIKLNFLQKRLQTIQFAANAINPRSVNGVKIKKIEMGEILYKQASISDFILLAQATTTIQTSTREIEIESKIKFTGIRSKNNNILALNITLPADLNTKNMPYESGIKIVNNRYDPYLNLDTTIKAEEVLDEVNSIAISEDQMATEDFADLLDELK